MGTYPDSGARYCLPDGVLPMSAVLVKFISCVLLLVFGIMFGFDLVPPYYRVGTADANSWATALMTLSLAQSAMTLLAMWDCIRCRVWSDFLLQITGLVFIILGGAFVTKYPPLTWAMWLFPLLGLLCLTTGREFSRYSRNKLQPPSIRSGGADRMELHDRT